MQIVIQRGDLINRQDIEQILRKLPASIEKCVDRIVVYASRDNILDMDYHAKEKTLAVHLPVEYSGTANEFIEEVAISMLLVIDHNFIPKKMIHQVRFEYKRKWNDLDRTAT